MTTEGLGPLATALAKAQSEFAPVTRDKEVKVELKTGRSYKFKYAPLDQILSVVRGPLSKNGLALAQLLDSDAMVTMLIHDSGASLEARTPLPSTGDIQAYGSAVTYLRRYAIQALLGIAAEDDDDGNRAAGNATEPIETTTSGQDSLELLGRIQKTGKVMAGGSDSYKGDWREVEHGHAIGFKLKLDGEDRDIPQVLVTGGIGESLFIGHPAILGERVTVKGHLYNVKRQGRTAFYRLIVGQSDKDFIETADLRVPPLPDPEQAVVDANPTGVSPVRGQTGFDLVESARLDAEEAARAG